MFIIYMAKNLINGHAYIGVTCKGLKRRKSTHLRYAKIGGRQCPRLYDAIRKYGASNFEWIVLASLKVQRHAYELEFELVDKLNPEYNACPGGQVGSSEPWNRFPVVCLEDGKMFESAKAAALYYGVDNSEICKACNGYRNRTFVAGRHFQWFDFEMSLNERMAAIKKLNAEVVEKRRRVPSIKRRNNLIDGGKDKIGRSAAGPASRSKPVICLDDGRVFSSVSAAGAHYGVNTSALSELCRGKRYRMTVGGRHFAFVFDVGQRWVA
jgi:hypothetical protein